MQTKQYNYLAQNSKIKKIKDIKTYNFGIPAYKSCTGFITCPLAGKCKDGCFALSGGYLFSNVKPVYEKRLQLTLQDTFVNTIDAELKRREVQRLRIHDSGDFYNAKYLDKWIRIMHLNPDTQFYAYTKMINLFNKYKSRNRLPNNFITVYSFGGKQDHLIKTDTDKHAQVFKSIEDLQAAGYIDASTDDTKVLNNDIRIGLVYHGVKKYSNTSWGK